MVEVGALVVRGGSVGFGLFVRVYAEAPTLAPNYSAIGSWLSPLWSPLQRFQNVCQNFSEFINLNPVSTMIVDSMVGPNLQARDQPLRRRGGDQLE